jgi:hypothetical protein
MAELPTKRAYKQKVALTILSVRLQVVSVLTLAHVLEQSKVFILLHSCSPVHAIAVLVLLLLLVVAVVVHHSINYGLSCSVPAHVCHSSSTSLFTKLNTIPMQAPSNMLPQLP